MDTVNKTCTFCGSVFLSRRANQHACTLECQQRGYYLRNADRLKQAASRYGALHPTPQTPERRKRHRAHTARWRVANREKHRAYSRDYSGRNPHVDRKRQLAKYGLTPETYEARLRQQGNACAICDATAPSKRRQWFDIDHCHRTNRVRGLLCERCNRALGLFGDDPSRLRRAADYLTQNSHVTDPR